MVLVKFSKLIKNNTDAKSIVTEEIINTLENVAQELLENDIIVEFEKINENGTN